MPRPLRLEYKGACYHVMNRGQGRRQIFAGAQAATNNQTYLDCLDQACVRFGAQVHAYCLLGKQYHLLIETPRGNLSRIMRHVDGIFTQRINRRRGDNGPIFKGRYKAVLLDASQHLLQASRYIHRQPLDAKKPPPAKLTDYPWSSYPAYVNKVKPPHWLRTDRVLDRLGQNKSERARAYRDIVAQGVDIDAQQFYQKKRSASVWGDAAFRAKAQKRGLHHRAEVQEKGFKNAVPLTRIVRHVAQFYQMPASAIKKTKRGQGVKNVPRWIAMRLCQEVAGAKLTEIASLFQVGHYSTVSQTIGRLNKLIEEDPATARQFARLTRELTS